MLSGARSPAYTVSTFSRQSCQANINYFYFKDTKNEAQRTSAACLKLYSWWVAKLGFNQSINEIVNKQVLGVLLCARPPGYSAGKDGQNSCPHVAYSPGGEQTGFEYLWLHEVTDLNLHSVRLSCLRGLCGADFFSPLGLPVSLTCHLWWRPSRAPHCAGPICVSFLLLRGPAPRVCLQALCTTKTNSQQASQVPMRGQACWPRAPGDKAFSLPERYPSQSRSSGAGLSWDRWSPAGWRWPHSDQCVWSWCRPRSRSARTCPPWCLGWRSPNRKFSLRGGYNPRTHGNVQADGQHVSSVIWLDLLHDIHPLSEDEETAAQGLAQRGSAPRSSDSPGLWLFYLAASGDIYLSSQSSTKSGLIAAGSQALEVVARRNIFNVKMVDYVN